MPAFRRRHVSRSCPGYSEIWAGDVRVKIFAALRAYADQVPEGFSPQVQMLTVTAPGEDAGLTWDEAHCAHLGQHRHSGRLGCRVASAPSAVWNASAPTWWRQLHHEASQATLRQVGHRPSLLVRPWELQQRGMLHVHPVLGRSVPVERAAATTYQRELAARAARHGFGFVDRKVQLRDPVAAAAYLSSYFVAGKKGKMTLREAVTSKAMPRSIVYVHPELSQASGITMRSLRLRRFAWQVWRRLFAWDPDLHDQITPDLIWQNFLSGKVAPSAFAAT